MLAIRWLLVCFEEDSQFFFFQRNASLEAQLTVSEERLAEVQRENEQLLNEVQSNERKLCGNNVKMMLPLDGD